jgi:hypothetical protein
VNIKISITFFIIYNILILIILELSFILSNDCISLVILYFHLIAFLQIYDKKLSWGAHKFSNMIKLQGIIFIYGCFAEYLDIRIRDQDILLCISFNHGEDLFRLSHRVDIY